MVLDIHASSISGSGTYTNRNGHDVEHDGAIFILTLKSGIFEIGFWLKNFLNFV